MAKGTIFVFPPALITKKQEQLIANIHIIDPNIIIVLIAIWRTSSLTLYALVISDEKPIKAVPNPIATNTASIINCLAWIFAFSISPAPSVFPMIIDIALPRDSAPI